MTGPYREAGKAMNALTTILLLVAAANQASHPVVAVQFAPVKSPITSPLRSKFCLDAGTRGALVMATCSGRRSQMFTYDALKRLVNIASGQCVDIKGKTKGSKVIQAACSATKTSQRWAYRTAGAQLRNQQAALCLTVPGAKKTDGVALDIWTCLSTSVANQKWRAEQPAQVIPPAPAPTVGGRQVLRSANGLCKIFPDDNWWHADISGLPVHRDSEAIKRTVGNTISLGSFVGPWEGNYGRPWSVVNSLAPGPSPFVPIIFTEPDADNDPSPFPFRNAKFEGGKTECQYGDCPPSADGSDRVAIVMDNSTCLLYETGKTMLPNAASNWAWAAVVGQTWDLSSNAWPYRPLHMTSVSLSGLPSLPASIKLSDIQAGRIDHAIVTYGPVNRNTFAFPATKGYQDSNDNPDAPWPGMRVRISSAFNCLDLPGAGRILCQGMQKHGAIFMDVSGGPTGWSFTQDENNPGWAPYVDDITTFTKIPTSYFEVVDPGCPFCDGWDCEAAKMVKCTNLPAPAAAVRNAALIRVRTQIVSPLRPNLCWLTYNMQDPWTVVAGTPLGVGDCDTREHEPQSFTHNCNSGARGDRQLFAQNSGMCVDLKGNSAAAGTAVVLSPCGDDLKPPRIIPSQQWRWDPEALTLSADHAPGMCVEVANGSPATFEAALQLAPCNGGTSQQFRTGA